jgi:ribonuclease HI
MSNTKEKIYLFTDGSVDPQKKEGFGVYLLLEKLEFLNVEQNNKIQIKKFNNTSSTKLELQTILWALDEVDLKNFKTIIYTDCQNIIGLEKRRSGFESKNYMTSKGTQIKNHELYKAFFKKMDILDCEFIKIKGHKKSSEKNEIDKIFTLVDKASRNALRQRVL